MDAVSGKFDINHLISNIQGIDGLAVALTEALKLYKEVASNIFHMAGWRDISAYIYGFLILAFSYAIILLALIEILMAKFAIAFLFVLLPVMSIFLVFGKTEKLFERHIGLLTGFALQLFFVPAVVGFALAFVKWSIIGGGIMHLTGIKDLNTTWSSIIPFLITAALGMAFVFKAAQWAQQIGSGIASGAGLAMMIAVSSAMMMGVKPLGKLLRPAGRAALNPVKTGKSIMGHPATQMAAKTAAFMAMGGAKAPTAAPAANPLRYA